MIPRILSIAGTDPTGGAGIQADLKSISAAGGFGMSAVTAVVSQNTRGVRAVHTPPPEVLAQQLSSVFDDVTVDAVKIGMLGDVATTSVVAEFLSAQKIAQVVLDPVMVASSGDRLLDQEAEDAVRALLQHVDVVTPNLRELGVLVKEEPATCFDGAVRQSLTLASQTSTTVIVKGGHLMGTCADNAVVRADGRVYRVPSHRVDTENTHGTGCSLSSALATRLGAGYPAEKALEWSTRWLHEAISHSDDLEVGSHGGNGPVDHSHRSRRLEAVASAQPWAHLSGDLPTVQAPAPHLVPAGPHTARLWELTGQVWSEIMSLPFIQGLRDGTLRREDFDFYLDQDAQYLNRYSRALAMLSATAPDHESQVGWSQDATGCLVTEAALHREWLGGHDMAYIAPSPVTMAYTNFLISTVATESYATGVAAVLPCAWLYAEIGLDLVEDNHAQHPYHAWLSTYADEEFLSGAQSAIARMEDALEQSSPKQRDAAAQAYLSACIYEREFFDQANRVW